MSLKCTSERLATGPFFSGGRFPSFGRKSVWLVSGVWENQDLFFLHESLIPLATSWGEPFPNNQPPCPIKFMEKDIELYYK
jgi:hypothetical protein